MPMRKVGSDTPMRDAVSRKRETQESRLSAVYTPIGMPTKSAISAAHAASSSVAGSLSTSSVDTGRPRRSEMPKLPCTALPMKVMNCT